MKRHMLVASAVLMTAGMVHAVDLAGEDLEVTTLAAEGYSNSGAVATLTIDLAADTAYSGVVSKNINVVKKGAGRLTLSSAWTCGDVTIQGGVIAVTKEANVCGSGSKVTLQDGGTLALGSTESIDANSARAIVVKKGSEGCLEVAAGKTVTFANWQDFITYTHAKLRLTGAGIPYLSGRMGASGTDGVVSAENGTVRNGNQVFGAASGPLHRSTMYIGEGVTADVLDNRFMTLPKYTVLKGATILATNQAQNYTNVVGRLAKTFESLTVGERVTVEASARPSRILNFSLALAPLTTETVFDVKAGATLEIHSRIVSGMATQNSSADYRQGQGFVKTGKGTLVLKSAVDADGLVHVMEGTLVLSREAYLSCAARLKCEAGAVVRLEDGATVAASVLPGQSLDPFLSTAQVWVDATRLPYANGQEVPNVPNLGKSGGHFHNFFKGANSVPVAPTMAASGINGKPCLFFKGDGGLVLNTYTNKTKKIHVFVVYQTTDVTSAHHVSFPLTMCCADGGTACGEATDAGTAGKMNGHVVFTPDGDWRRIMADHGAKRYTLDFTGVCGDASTPIVLEHLRDGDYKDQNVGGKVFFGTDSTYPASGFFTSNGYSVNQDIEQVAIGCRLMTDGSAREDIGYSSTRFMGYLGEVLVFNEYLMGDQRTYVENYLRNKWLGSNGTIPTLPGYTTRLAVTNLVLDVADGRAAFAPGASGTAPTEANTVVKKGAGELVYAGAEPDVTALSVAAGDVAFADANGGSAAAIWIDASDAASVTEEDGVVRAIRNKGAAGGVFAQNPHYDAALEVTKPTPCPRYATGTDGINGLGALAFDNFSALSTEAYTNRNGHSISVYGVFLRTDWRSSTSSGPFCMTQLASSSSDVKSGDYLLWQDNGIETRRVFYCKSVADGSYIREGFCDTSVPFLMAIRVATNLFTTTEYTAVDGKMKDHSGVYALKDAGTHLQPFSLDFVQLGGRVRQQGVPFCPTDKSWGMNRMWNGRIGELVVFNRPLAQKDEKALFDYLSKKWFNVGTGSAEPPAFLAGRAAAPSFRTGTDLSLAAGTTVSFETAGAVSVGALAAPGSVTVRVSKSVKAAWRPLLSFETFADDLSSWTLVGSRHTLMRRGNEIGVCAPGMMVIVR